MSGAGRLSSHRITFLMKGADVSLNMSLKGGYRLKTWHAGIGRMDIAGRRYGVWTLPRPASLKLASGMAFADLCLANGKARVCLKAHLKKPEGLHAEFNASRVPVGLFQQFLSPGTSISGTLDGNANVFYTQSEMLTGPLTSGLRTVPRFMNWKGKRNVFRWGKRY